MRAQKARDLRVESAIFKAVTRLLDIILADVLFGRLSQLENQWMILELVKLRMPDIDAFLASYVSRDLVKYEVYLHKVAYWFRRCITNQSQINDWQTCSTDLPRRNESADTGKTIISVRQRERMAACITEGLVDLTKVYSLRIPDYLEEKTVTFYALQEDNKTLNELYCILAERCSWARNMIEQWPERPACHMDEALLEESLSASYSMNHLDNHYVVTCKEGAKCTNYRHSPRWSCYKEVESSHLDNVD